MHIQKWGMVVLTELAFRENGVRSYHHLGRTWYLVVCTRVGFLLSEHWWARRQSGGAVLHTQEP